ncbi:MAG: STAS domain-containing protein [Thermogutta sp.]|nr:STAS domain-containing protein [Thermogutta sp.]
MSQNLAKKPLPEFRHLDVYEVDDVTVVHFKDQRILEDLAIQELGQELFYLVDVEQRKKLLLNFANVNFLSSGALGKLNSLEKKIRNLGGVVKLCSIQPTIYKVFEITRFNTIFEIFKSEADALASF